MPDLTLVIGNRNYSSWSLRPWLALAEAGIAFAEIMVALWEPGYEARVRAHSPSGRVPVLRHGAVTVWESLAICEYVAELAPAARLWPEDAAARAHARAIAAEMHAGFAALRRELPMNIRARKPGRPVSPEAAADIARIAAIWSATRARFGAGGALLFGRFTIADAMYAPVAARFATYDVALPPEASAYRDAVLALPAMRRWAEAAAQEPQVVERLEI